MTLPGVADYPDRYQFRFCPICATELRLALLHDQQRRRCPACGWTHYPLPNLASTVVITYQDGIVLVQRDIEPDRGIWHLPIGHIEYGEEPAAAALREGREETGLELDDARFLCYTHSPSYADPRLWYLVFAFSARAVGGQLTGSSEGRNCRIVPLQQLPELKWTSQRAAITAFRRLQSDTRAHA
jgi:ADP-ribose pyrophosphatase YjhB (NUDIX family)